MTEKSFWQRNQTDKAQKWIAREAKKMRLDHRALNIAYNMTYDMDAFDPALTKRMEPPEEDINYGVENKTLLVLPYFEHNQLVDMLRDTIENFNKEKIVGAFVASLLCGTDQRGALRAYAYHLNLPQHPAAPDQYGHDECEKCGLRRIKDKRPFISSVLRFNGSGPNHKNPMFALENLKWFQKLPILEPSQTDWNNLSSIFDAIRALPKTAQLKELNDCLKGLVKGNKYSRQAVLETLGYCGIVTAGHLPAVLRSWTSENYRDPPHFYKRDWQYPASWWTGEEGLNEEAIQFWFPQVA